MTARKNDSAEAAGSKGTGLTFSKEQILASAKYAGRRDLVDALLEADRQYTKTEVDGLINRFMKGRVK